MIQLRIAALWMVDCQRQFARRAEFLNLKFEI